MNTKILLPTALGILALSPPCLAETSGAADNPEAYRFQAEVLLERIPQPMHLALTPDGSIIFTELLGRVKRLDPSTGAVVELGALEVATGQENGLLGMALDPNFATNNRIYLYFSPEGYEGQILSRFEIVGDELVMATRHDILHVAEQRDECCHHGGTLRFGPDGLLYLSTGDNTSPFASDGFSPIDERPGREPFDAQKSAANTNDLRGKILRIRLTEDGGYEIPEGNLFPPDTDLTRPEIYAMGFRNPWRFDIDPATGWLYVGDVGPDSGGFREERGPMGYDIFNQIRTSGNYGWPYFRGDQSYRDYDFATELSGEAFHPEAPVNESPSNTGLRVLPPVTPPTIYYAHRKDEKWPSLKTGGRTSCGGPVFHYQEGFEASNGFPAYYDKAVLFYDWQRPFLKWLRLDDQGEVVKMEDFPAVLQVAQGPDPTTGPLKLRRPVDMTFGPDGVLYFLDYGESWSVNDDARIVKVSYLRGDVPPVAKAEADCNAGKLPLTIHLSAANSYSPQQSALTYEWTLLPEGRSLGKDAQVTAELTTAGNFEVELTVRDEAGQVAQTTLPITAGNARPLVKATKPAPGLLYRPGDTIEYEFQVEDAEEGSSLEEAESFGARTLVTTRWLGHDGQNVETEPGFSLIKQNHCLSCHAMEKKLIGPSYYEVANRYRGIKEASLASAERIVKGSAGVWGEVPMLPHPHLSLDEAHLMVTWIFALDPTKPATSMTRGLSGKVIAPDDPRVASCIIEAAFTDAGHGPTSPLTGEARVKLHSRFFEAEAGELIGVTKSADSDASGGLLVDRTEPGRELVFRNIDLRQLSKVTVRARSNHSAPAIIEFRAKGKDGPLLGTVEVRRTAHEGFEEFAGSLESLAGSGDLHLVFQSEVKGNTMGLDWFRLD